MHVHTTTNQIIGDDGKIDLSNALEAADTICKGAPLFILGIDGDGSLNGKVLTASAVGDKDITVDVSADDEENSKYLNMKSTTVMVD